MEGWSQLIENLLLRTLNKPQKVQESDTTMLIDVRMPVPKTRTRKKRPIALVVNLKRPFKNLLAVPLVIKISTG